MAFYITLGNDGGIWIGKPNTTTGSGVLRKEASGVVEVLYQAACDNEDTSGAFNVIVVGQSGSILRSQRNGDDPGTWTKVHQASYGLEGIAYGGGKWIAVGKNNLVVTSTNGTTWTESRGAYSGAQWNWLAYGNSKFVAVGSATVGGQSVGAVMYSDDGGLKWIKGNAGTSSHLQSVAYSPTLNVFVAVGNNGAIVTVKG